MSKRSTVLKSELENAIRAFKELKKRASNARHEYFEIKKSYEELEKELRKKELEVVELAGLDLSTRSEAERLILHRGDLLKIINSRVDTNKRIVVSEYTLVNT